MSEMGALLAIDDAVQSGKYSTVVVDTAPFGHTLRLFALPEQFARLLKFLELAAVAGVVNAGEPGAGPTPMTVKFRTADHGESLGEH